VNATTTWIHPVGAFGLAIAAAVPLGGWMAGVLDLPADRHRRGLDAVPVALCRLLGLRTPAGMGWKSYAVALLAFNMALFVLTFGLLSAQPYLPFNPDGKGALGALGAGGSDTGVVFNTVCSFVTNCSLQHYAGEQHLSYLSQLGVITFLDFVSTATGLACLAAVVRGLRGDEHLGDFYFDMMRGLVLVLVPLAAIVALALVATGVPMTFHARATAQTLEGPAQAIARGPAAALIAIKQLGTIGGGFFGPNATHPLENPTPWSNLLEEVAILLLPMAAIVMFGVMLRERRQAVVVFGVMLVPTLAAAALAIWSEIQPSPATSGLPVAVGPNLEGKEIRVGAAPAATWVAITTAASNGSVDAMHDSLNPMAGLAALSLMLLNCAFSGVGSGYLHMLLYILIAVFLGGLMVGRTPEYLGRKVEAKEVKLAMLAMLLHPLIICVPAALFAATPWGQKAIANPGPHGFTEIFYEFASSAATNGSGFEGLADNNPPWNIATGIVMLLGRYPALILPLAIAGSLAAKPRLPQTIGTLRTDTWTFAGLLCGTMLLVGALSFLPALALGPIAEQLMGAGP
jgi:K+-transporting ATPase ATPase A chain